eukprot:sb/3466643/
MKLPFCVNIALGNEITPMLLSLMYAIKLKGVTNIAHFVTFPIGAAAINSPSSHEISVHDILGEVEDRVGHLFDQGSDDPPPGSLNLQQSDDDDHVQVDGVISPSICPSFETIPEVPNVVTTADDQADPLERIDAIVNHVDTTRPVATGSASVVGDSTSVAGDSEVSIPISIAWSTASSTELNRARMDHETENNRRRGESGSTGLAWLQSWGEGKSNKDGTPVPNNGVVESPTRSPFMTRISEESSQASTQLSVESNRTSTQLSVEESQVSTKLSVEGAQLSVESVHSNDSLASCLLCDWSVETETADQKEQLTQLHYHLNHKGYSSWDGD